MWSVWQKIDGIWPPKAVRLVSIHEILFVQTRKKKEQKDD
jgi:hypothetical protein